MQIVLLRIFPATFKQPVLQQIWFVASYMNTDFWLDKITRESRYTRELRHLPQNKFALGQ